jgi:Uma2 family endonuclease
MASAAVKPRVSVAEYLAFERAAETKHEYRDGEIVSMPGVSVAHDRIVINLIVELGGRLRESPFEVHGPEMRTYVEPGGLFTYPDVSIYRFEARVLDSHQDTLLDAVAIVEVLSPSTEDYDRGDKFRRYRRMASLREYVLVAQDRIRVERYVRGVGRWKKTVLERSEDVLVLESVGCEVAVGAIYTRVPLSGARNPPEI